MGAGAGAGAEALVREATVLSWRPALSGDTVTLVVAKAVPRRAVTPVTPAERAMTCPFWSTCATASLSLDHSTVAGASPAFVDASACTVIVSPTASETAAGRVVN